MGGLMLWSYRMGGLLGLVRSALTKVWVNWATLCVRWSAVTKIKESKVRPNAMHKTHDWQLP